MESVMSLLGHKGHAVWSVAPGDSAFDALKLMAEKNIGAVLVVENETPVGIFSERDYARGIVLKDRTSRTTPVAEIMSRNVFYVRPEQSIEECMVLMTDKHLRHLPVLENERLIGLVSIGDVVKAYISRQDLKIRHMHNQIVGYDQFHRF